MRSTGFELKINSSCNRAINILLFSKNARSHSIKAWFLSPCFPDANFSLLWLKYLLSFSNISEELNKKKRAKSPKN